MNLGLYKPAIVPLVESAGVILHRRGRLFVSLCPFHSERNPSFIVDPDRQRFKCFGCGEGGDVIDLIQRLHGVSFKGALAILRMSRDKLNPETKLHLEALKAFREWCREYHSEVVTLLNTYRWIIRGIKTDADLELVAAAGLFGELPQIENEEEILFSGSDMDKLALARGKKDGGNGRIQP